VRDVSTFRPPRSTFLILPALHGLCWAAAVVVTGISTFEGTPPWIFGGLFSGLLHAALQWATTGVTVADGCITTRNLFWVRHIATSEIEAVHRLRRDRWRGVSVAPVDGTEEVLAAPSANAIALNPHFDEDVHRLCATIALSSGPLGPADEH